MEPIKCKDNRSMGETCLINTDCYMPSGEDRDFWYDVLRKESSTLFQTAGGGVDVLCSAQDNGLAQTPPRQYFVTSGDIVTKGIQQFLRGSRWQHLIFIAHSAFSWSQLSITEPAFRTVLADLQIFTPFLRLVPAFGAKTNDKQRTKDCLYYRVEPSSIYGGLVPEMFWWLCYIDRRGNPWSLRQTGVYQKRLSSQQSVWFLLNYSNYVTDRVSKALKAESVEANHHCDVLSLQPHLFILSAATRNWGPYIKSLRQTVLTLEEKAYSSSVDTVCLDDYAILFKDIQKLASLSDTLSLAKTIITGQRDVLSKCADLHIVLHKGLSGQCDCGTVNTLEMLKADLQHHYNELVNLARTSSMTTQLLYAILRSRANDKLQASVAIMHTSIVSLQLQSQQTCQDTTNLLKLSSEGVKDATIVKILAQTATMFLPASLIASIFSSTVFGGSGNRSYVGLYFAITIPLLVVTALFLFILEKGLPRARL